MRNSDFPALAAGSIRFLLAAALAVGVAGPGIGCSLLDGIKGDDDTPAGPDGGLGGSCARTSECADNLVCAGGICQLEGSVGLGGPCTASRDCGAGLFCAPATQSASNAGVCAPAGTGEVGDPCATAAECERGLTCELFGFGGQCAEGGAADAGQSCTATADCLSGLVCAADGTCKSPREAYPPFAGIECAPDLGPFRAFFEVPRPGQAPAEFFRMPFPTDVRVSAQGELDMSGFARPGPSLLGVDVVGTYLDALIADFEGFSPVGIVTFRFATRLDFDTTGAATLELVDVTPGAAEFGRPRAISWGYTTGRTKWNCQNRLTMINRIDDPLLPGHTYAAYLTTGVRSESGEAAVQDPDLTAVLAAQRPADDEALGHAWDVHQPFRDFLATKTLDPATIASVAVFTTMDATRRMRALASATAAEPAPAVQDLTLCDGTAVSPCDDGDQRVCGAPDADYYEVHGRVRIPIFQEGEAPYAVQGDGGAIHFEGAAAVKVRDELVCFGLSIPKAAVGPLPLVVFGHGTGGSFRSMFGSGVARALATSSSPAAVLGFDGVVHGARKAGSTRDSDNLMFNVINPVAARDNGLQGAVDVLTALRVPEAGPLTIAGIADPVSFDDTRVYYFGHSQGSNVGIPALATAASDLVPAAVFSGAGGFLSSSLLDKTSPVDVSAGLQFLLGDPDFDAGHPVMTVLQTYFDSSDTINYGPLLIRRPPDGAGSKHIMMTYGPGDTFSPPSAIKNMAAAASLELATPVIDEIGLNRVSRPVSDNLAASGGGLRFGAIFQYQPDGDDGHFVAFRDAGAVADWTAFFSSLIATGTPVVP